MEKIISTTRRPDITFHASGIIYITHVLHGFFSSLKNPASTWQKKKASTFSLPNTATA